MENHRVRRVAMVTLWRTFHHEGKICPGLRVGGARPPPFTRSTITYKIAVCSPAERADTLPLFLLYPYMYSVSKTVQNGGGRDWSGPETEDRTRWSEPDAEDRTRGSGPDAEDRTRGSGPDAKGRISLSKSGTEA
jgi:hypothetical protein